MEFSCKFAFAMILGRNARCIWLFTEVVGTIVTIQRDVRVLRYGGRTGMQVAGSSAEVRMRLAADYMLGKESSIKLFTSLLLFKVSRPSHTSMRR